MFLLLWLRKFVLVQKQILDLESIISHIFAHSHPVAKQHLWQVRFVKCYHRTGWPKAKTRPMLQRTMMRRLNYKLEIVGQRSCKSIPLAMFQSRHPGYCNTCAHFIHCFFSASCQGSSSVCSARALRTWRNWFEQTGDLPIHIDTRSVPWNA